jgi:hypothetical protein
MNARARFRISLPALVAGSAFALGACSGSVDHAAVANVAVTTTTVIPPDGQCTHIIATRLSDFTVSEYKGVLAGATLQALTGDHRVTATAYPQPCSSEPATAPWIINPLVVTFATGNNTLPLEFKRNVPVAISPVFDQDPSPMIIRPGTQVRTGRNGEDATGPNFSLDGWELRQIPLPPAKGAETLVFSLFGKGVPYTPRGVARMPDGSFVFQLSEPTSPLYAFTAMGTANGTWPITYAAGLIQWDATDGIEAIDATHLVRTGWSNTPLNCDAMGNNCTQSGLDILTRTINMDGTSTLQVQSQVILKALPMAPINAEYPVGVAALPGGKVAVTTLPNAGGSRLIILDPTTGNVVAGPTAIAGDVEGLFDDGTGRIIALDYTGNLTTYNDTTAAVRAGETASFPIGAGFSVPLSLTWRSAGTGSYIALSSNKDLDFATPAFDMVTPTGIDLSLIQQGASIDYRPDTDELVIGDRIPFTDAMTGIRSPSVYFYGLTSKALTRTVRLATGLALPLRLMTVAYVPATQQLFTHFRRPGNAKDVQVDAVVYVHNLDGSLATKFDLSPLGIVHIQSINYRASSDELFLQADDISKTTRILVTDRMGTPHRSYRVDAFPDVIDMTPIASGPFAGDFGAIANQPSSFARISLP